MMKKMLYLGLITGLLMSGFQAWAGEAT